jgi:hypothetical protein
LYPAMHQGPRGIYFWVVYFWNYRRRSFNEAMFYVKKYSLEYLWRRTWFGNRFRNEMLSGSIARLRNSIECVLHLEKKSWVFRREFTLLLNCWLLWSSCTRTGRVSEIGTSVNGLFSSKVIF